MGRFRKASMGDGGRRAQILLLDGQRLDIVIQPRLFVSELLSIIASHCDLRDPERHYFGLAFVDEQNHYHWLPRDRRVLEFEFPRKFATSSSALLILQHNVKFFVDKIGSLQHPSTVELYFLEAKLQLSKGHLILSDVDFYHTGAYLLQIWCGNYKDEETALAALRTVVSIPQRFLRNYGVTLADCESNILHFYKDLIGTPRGTAILNFLQIAERSPTYGSHFYAVRDKSGTPWLVGINSNGICQYDVDDITIAKKVFHWRFLENLYYRDRKFSIEVYDKRRIVHSLSTSNLDSLLGGTTLANALDHDDGLIDAVNHPTTQVSLSRRAFTPSSTIHAFFCDTPFLCKTLWSTAIAQHQFFLDQRANSTISKNRCLNGSYASQSGVNLNELTEKLNRLVSHSSLGSSLPSLSSLNSSASTASTMPSARVADGSSAGSLPSLQSAYSQRSEEDRQRDLERFRELKAKKNELADRLTAIYQELRDTCVQEGEIIGEMPKEIYRCLMPGEPEPKIKRRVGTSFSIPQDLLEKQVSKEDRVGRLEADIEMQRQIVMAAKRLATDKSTNKSVRKKRQKDYQHSFSRLKQMEAGLKLLRISSSKPDISTAVNETKNNRGRAWPNFSGQPAGTPVLGRMMARSCPATPRGSVPDLCTTTDNERSDDEDFSRPPSSASSMLRFHGGANGLPPVVPGGGRRPTYPLSNQHRFEPPMAPPASALDTPYGSSPSLPIYENVGYKTSVPYKSSYRQHNFPTLHDQQEWRVQRAHSEHSLPSDSSGIASSGTPDPPIHPQDYRNAGGDVIGHNVGAYNVTCQRTSWDYRSIDQGLNKVNGNPTGQDELDDGIETEEYDNETNTTATLTSKTEDNRCTRVQPSIRGQAPPNSSPYSAFGIPISPLKHPKLPVQQLNGYGTASLDRRALKNRQLSTGQTPIIVNCPSPKCSPGRASPINGDRRDLTPSSSPYRLGVQQKQQRDTSPTIRLSPGQHQRMTTTFPVTNGDMSKPLESIDVYRYYQQQHLRPRSPLVNPNSSSTSSTSSITSTSSPRHHNSTTRPPPPAYAAVVQRSGPNSSSRLLFGANSPNSSANSTASGGQPRTDPKMEALLDYYKSTSTSSMKPKTATIV